MMLSKIEPKTQDNKRALNFKSDHLSFLLDSDSIINPSIRDKRFKRINIQFDINTFSNQSNFKPKSFILLTAFILSLLNQRVFKSRSFTSFIFINIIRRQITVVFFKIYSNKRIFERDFPYYNKALNKTFR